jgi:hypothetical protein
MYFVVSFISNYFPIVLEATNFASDPCEKIIAIVATRGPHRFRK